MKWKMWLVLPMLMSLTGCDEANSDIVVSIVCPAIERYDRATQDRALAELNALPPGSALRKLVGDYAHLRDQIRLCRSRQVPASQAKAVG